MSQPAPPVASAPPTTPGPIARPPRPVRADAHLRPPAWVRWWARVDVVLAVLWLVWTAEQASNVSLTGLPAVGVVLSGLYLAGAWAVRAVAQLAWVVRHKPAPVRTLRPALAFVLIPAIGLVGMAFEATTEDTALRVRLSEWPLLAEAESMRAGAPFSGRGWYGLFYVHSATLEGDEVRFVTKHGFLFDEFGISHRLDATNEPPNEPANGPVERRPIGSGWSVYTTTDQF